MDNALIIKFYQEMSVGVASVDSKQQSYLDCYDLSPANVAAICVPTGNESSSVPLATKNYADSPRR